MAEQKDLDFTYTTIDKIFRLSVGETGDYSGAKYDGDFSMSLEEAQKANGSSSSETECDGDQSNEEADNRQTVQIAS